MRNRLGLVALSTVMLFVGWTADSRAQLYPSQASQYHRYYYYPYYYFPHNYWPVYSPPWPEPIGSPYMRPPAYMSYPPFLQQGWRYDFWQPARYYRGNHFWLDQF